MLPDPAMKRIDAAVTAGSEKARALVNCYVGQGVGLAKEMLSCRSVMHDFTIEFAAALEDLPALAGGL